MKHAAAFDAKAKVPDCQGFEDTRAFRFRLKNTRTDQIVHVKGVSLAEAVRLFGWDPALVQWIVQAGPQKVNPKYLSASGWQEIVPPFQFVYTPEGG
jgi:hypothetical protein